MPTIRATLGSQLKKYCRYNYAIDHGIKDCKILMIVIHQLIQGGHLPNYVKGQRRGPRSHCSLKPIVDRNEVEVSCVNEIWNVLKRTLKNNFEGVNYQSHTCYHHKGEVRYQRILCSYNHKTSNGDKDFFLRGRWQDRMMMLLLSLLYWGRRTLSLPNSIDNERLVP